MWGGITFGTGIVLIIIDAYLATRKKEGFTPIDRQRLIGVFWLTTYGAALVMALIWMTPE
jgi:hypothetical protein